MKFTPPKTDKYARFTYGISLILSLLLMMIKAQGIVKTVFSSLSLILLCFSLYLLIRYEMTSYTYCLFAKDRGFDFIIDKATGKRSSYVCYYPLSDMVLIDKYDKNNKEKLKETYKNIHFYNYSQSIFTGEKYIIIFANTNYFDAVIFEPCTQFADEVKRFKELIDERSNEEASENKTEPDENSINIKFDENVCDKEKEND